jgi:hypothetical protein
MGKPLLNVQETGLFDTHFDIQSSPEEISE